MKKNLPMSVDYANIHWFRNNNIRHGDKSWGNPLADIDFRLEVVLDTDGKTPIGEKIVTSASSSDKPLVRLLADGWEAREGVATVMKATAKQSQEAIADRKAIIAEMKKDEAMLPMAVTLEEVWFPNGKSAPVEWIANNCYRRSIGIRGVLTRRRTLVPDGWDRTFVVICESKEFASDRAKLVDHILENTRKAAGRKELQPVDYFFQAVELRKIDGASARESDLVRMDIKRGEAQRAFALAKMASELPELNLIDRCNPKSAPKKDGEGKQSPYLYVAHKSYIDVAKLRHADVVRLNNGYTAESSGEEGKLTGRNAKLKAIEAYIRTAMTGSKPKPVTIADATEAMANHPVYLLQTLALKLSRAEAGKFTESLTAHADKINKALAFLVKEDTTYAEVVNQETAKEDAA